MTSANPWLIWESVSTASYQLSALLARPMSLLHLATAARRWHCSIRSLRTFVSFSLLDLLNSGHLFKDTLFDQEEFHILYLICLSDGYLLMMICY